MIPKWSLAVLQRTINAYLKLDIETFQQLSKLTGKVVKIEFAGLPHYFFIRITKIEIILTEQYNREPHATIKGTPFAFASAAFVGPGQMQGIKFSGDISLAQKLYQLIRAVDIDWEGYLANYVGDIAAHQIGLMARNAQAVLRKTGASLQQMFTEYVQEEARLSPGQEELADFCDAVDQLRDDVVRATAKLQQKSGLRE